MTKPDDIPQDVWEAAQFARLHMMATDDFDTHAEIIARVIMAERERWRGEIEKLLADHVRRSWSTEVPSLVDEPEVARGHWPWG